MRRTNTSAGPWDAVLFDLDGTLADSVDLILHCYRHTMQIHLGAEQGDDLWLASMGMPLREQLRAFARSDDEAAAMTSTYVAQQRALHDAFVRVFAGVPEVLTEVRSSGVPVALVTGKRKDMTDRTLSCCGLAGMLDAIVTPDSVERGKPAPDPVFAAMAELGVTDAARVLFVGDAPVDLQAGRAAGVRTAAALWGPFGREALQPYTPDYWLDRIHDLLPIVRTAEDAGPPHARESSA